MSFHILLFVYSLLFVTHIALKPIFSDETPLRDNYSTMAHSVKHYFNLFVNKNASMKASCVIHPDCEPMIIVRKWQLDFCNGNKSAAALLSFFEYWHNIKLEQSKKAKFQNNIANIHHDIGYQDESLYQFHTMDELEHGVLLYSRDAINSGLKILVDKKVISIHKNPNPKYSFDRT